MATAWSDWAGGNSYNFRDYVSVEISASSDSAVQVHVEGGYQSAQAQGSYFESRLYWSTDGGASWALLADVTGVGVGTYSTGATSSSDPNSGRNFGGGYTVWYRHWLGSPNSSVASFREGVDAVTSVTIPARPYLAPRPPKSVALDCAGSYPVLTWAGDYDSSSSAQPWSGIYVSRSTDGGTAQRIASLSWSATNYTDSSVEAGHRYDYSVCSYNATGSSSTVSAGTAYTAPTPFASATLTATGTTSLSLAASGGSQWWDDLEWQLWSGGAWGATQTASALPVTMSAQAGTVQARIRKVKSSRASDWATSDTVTTIAQPLAPSVRVACDPLAIGSAQVVSWATNHPDGSAQSAAQVELTPPTGTAAVTDVTDATTSLSIPASSIAATGGYRVRVRTHGVWDGWGAWSSYARFVAATLPDVAFSAPPATVSAMPVPVAWSVTSDSGVSAQSISLLDPTGAILVTWGLLTDSRALAISSTDCAIANDTSYSLGLTVRAGSGLQAVATTSFSTSWTAPAPATATVDLDDALAAHVLVAAGTGTGSTPATTSVDVERVNPDGSRAPLGTYEPGQTAIDRLPPLNVSFGYRLVSHAESGATSTSVVPYVADSLGAEAYNFGASATVGHLLSLDASVSETIRHDVETYHFALGAGADDLPTAYASGDMDVNGSRSYVVTSPAEYLALRRTARSSDGATCWYRDVWGNRAFGVPTFEFAYDAAAFDTWKASVTFTECVWEDPVG